MLILRLLKRAAYESYWRAAHRQVDPQADDLIRVVLKNADLDLAARR